jgi:hypothetical protein
VEQTWSGACPPTRVGHQSVFLRNPGPLVGEDAVASRLHLVALSRRAHADRAPLHFRHWLPSKSTATGGTPPESLRFDRGRRGAICLSQQRYHSDLLPLGKLLESIRDRRSPLRYLRQECGQLEGGRAILLTFVFLCAPLADQEFVEEEPDRIGHSDQVSTVPGLNRIYRQHV